MKILSTKILSTDQQHAFEREAWELHMCQVIAVQSRGDDHIYPALEIAANTSANVIFTSKEAVRIVKNALGANKPIHWKIYCINGATEAAINEWLGQACIFASAKDAQHLTNLMNEIDGSIETYFFCASQRSNVLPDYLASRHINYKEVVVYDIVPVSVKIEDTYEVYLFFSPSAVQSYLQNNPLPLDARIVTIGDTTMQYLQQLQYQQVHAAAQPTVSHMIEKIKTLWN